MDCIIYKKMTESSQNIILEEPVKEVPVKKVKKEKKVKPNIILIEETEPVITQFENIYKESEAVIKANFIKCVTGYHLCNSSPINETIWEDLNSIVFSSVGIEVYSQSDGSHLSGMDINCSLGGISNKSAKYASNRKSIDISSYRLTTVCSEKTCGIPSEIVQEINKRKNFTYYSFIVRDETSDSVSYDWLLIPSNYICLDPASYTWVPTIGKRGKNKDAQVGWNTNEINGCKMSITFSMSSQLWIHIEMTEEIKQFIIASATVSNKPKYNYIELVDKLA
jgi:hypothetical protein